MIREMTIHDYERMYALWQAIDGLSLSEADSEPNIAMYLERNRGLSHVCEEDGRIAGTILCGHDGRRGFIYHLAVHPAFRKRRIGQQLVGKSLQGLRAAGIDKCHIFVLDDNEVGHSFWSRMGWSRRSGFAVFSIDV